MWQRWTAEMGWGLCWLLSLAASLPAADLALTDLLPADTAACLEIRRLDEHWQEWQTHPLQQRWTRSPLWPLLQQSRPWQRWQALEAVVAAHTDRKLSEHIRDAASRSLVLSLQIGPEGRPRGLVLAQSLRKGAADDFVAAWKKIEPARKFETVDAEGLTYLRTTRGNESVYLLVADDVLGLSDQEALIRDALRRLQGNHGADALSQAEWWQRVNDLTSPETLVLLGVHARAWDPLLAEIARNDPEAGQLQAIWQVIDKLRGEIRLSNSLDWSLQANLVEEQLSKSWWSLLQNGHRRTRPNFQTDAWLVIQGGFDVGPVLEMLRAGLTPKERDDWRQMERVAGGLGSGLELASLLTPLTQDYFLAVDGDDNGRMPLQTVLELRWDETQPAELAQVYERFLTLGLGLLAVDANVKSPEGEPVTIRQDQASENGPVRCWLDPGMLGWRPGFQVWKQALVLASDPEAAILQEIPAPMAVVDAQPPLGGPAIAVQVNLKGFREHVQQNSALWLALLSQGNSDREPEIVANWQKASLFLALVDRAWVSLRCGTSEVTLHGGLAADSPAGE